jgi:hypothetical protein
VNRSFSKTEQCELDPYARLHPLDLMRHSGYPLLSSTDKKEVDEAIDSFHCFGIGGASYYSGDRLERFRSYEEAEALRNDFVKFGAMRRRLISKHPNDLSDFDCWTQTPSLESASAWFYAAARDFVNECQHSELDLLANSRLVMRHFQLIFNRTSLNIAKVSSAAARGGSAQKTKGPVNLLKDRIVEAAIADQGTRTVEEVFKDWADLTKKKVLDGIKCKKMNCAPLLFKFTEEDDTQVSMALATLKTRISKARKLR